jgi:hypothetical protein
MNGSINQSIIDPTKQGTGYNPPPIDEMEWFHHEFYVTGVNALEHILSAFSFLRRSNRIESNRIDALSKKKNESIVEEKKRSCRMCHCVRHQRVSFAWATIPRRVFLQEPDSVECISRESIPRHCAAKEKGHHSLVEQSSVVVLAYVFDKKLGIACTQARKLMGTNKWMSELLRCSPTNEYMVFRVFTAPIQFGAELHYFVVMMHASNDAHTRLLEPANRWN